MADDNKAAPGACMDGWERRVWRRVHRPEEYVHDVLKFAAREIKVPYFLLAPLAPIAAAVLHGWEDAAVEHTEFVSGPGGQRTLRTFFKIHNYSNSRVYHLIEEIMTRIGVGKSMKLKQPDIDFMWLALGGVLNDYAACARVSKKSTDALLDFRLRNSDYLTVTTWYGDAVEIANLETGKVDTIELPSADIDCVANWAVDYQKKICGKKSCEIDVNSGGGDEFNALMKRYCEVKASFVHGDD